MASLNEAEKELFEQYCEAQGDIESIIRYETYASALKFGILLMVEIFSEQRETERGAEVK